MKSRSKFVINRIISESMDDYPLEDNVSWVPSKNGKGRGKLIHTSQPEIDWSSIVSSDEETVECTEPVVREYLSDDEKGRVIENAMDEVLSEVY